MTVDMTNNRVPYGMLSDEEKAALHEHEKAGGVFKVSYESHLVWTIVPTPTWKSFNIYRTVPLPKTQDVIDDLTEQLEAARHDAKEAEAYAEELQGDLTELCSQLIAAEAKLAKAVEGLRSIAANTCCTPCQEAALVARATLAEIEGEK